MGFPDRKVVIRDGGRLVQKRDSRRKYSQTESTIQGLAICIIYYAWKFHMSSCEDARWKYKAEDLMRIWVLPLGNPDVKTEPLPSEKLAIYEEGILCTPTYTSTLASIP